MKLQVATAQQVPGRTVPALGQGPLAPYYKGVQPLKESPRRKNAFFPPKL